MFIICKIFKKFKVKIRFCSNLQIFFDALEALAVDGTAAVCSDRRFMGLGGIAFVLGKSKLGVVLMVFLHDSVPGYFGNNRCCRNGDAQAVTFAYGLLRQVGFNPEGAVDQQIVGRGRQFPHRFVHGKKTRLQDIYTIYFFRLHKSPVP